MHMRITNGESTKEATITDKDVELGLHALAKQHKYQGKMFNATTRQQLLDIMNQNSMKVLAEQRKKLAEAERERESLMTFGQGDYERHTDGEGFLKCVAVCLVVAGIVFGVTAWNYLFNH